MKTPIRLALCVIALTASLSFAAFAANLPNPAISPGATNPDVTQENIQSTICVKGFTKTIRPPAYVTNRLKKQQIAEYGLEDTNPKHYEEDHLIALEIGGAPNDPRNLWPQPWSSEWGAKKKDQIENRLHRMVCDGDLSLADAQRAMASNWIEAWKSYVHNNHEHI